MRGSKKTHQTEHRYHSIPGIIPRSPKQLFVLAPVILAFLIRLWFILTIRKYPISDPSPQIVDTWVYHRWALEIIQGNFWGSDVFFLIPLYPYLLAFFYALFGTTILPVQIFQTLLATISCILLMKITHKLFNRTTAVIAGGIFALTGVLVFYSSTLLYVELTVFLSLLTIYLLLLSTGKWWQHTLTGIFYGLFVICRPEMLILLSFLLLWQIKFRKENWQALTNFALTTALVIAVIPIRNYLIARDPVIFTAHSGINFYFGNNPSADGTWQPAKELDPGFGFSHERLKRVAKFINGRELSWSQASFYWLKQGINFILKYPSKYLKLLGRKLLLFFANYEIPNNYYFETILPFSLPLKIAFINFGSILALALIGIIISWQNRKKLSPVYIFIVGYLLSSLLFYVLSRLRAPVIPLLIIFASHTVEQLYQILTRRQVKKFALILIGALLIYLATNLIPIDRRAYSAQAWTQLGNIYLEKKKALPAITAFQTALRYDQNNYSARYSLIETYAGMRRIPEAEQELKKLIATAPDLPSFRSLIYLASARIAIARRDFPAALHYYQFARQLDPDNPEIDYLIGLVYISLNNLTTAEQHFKLALKLDPTHEGARTALDALRHQRFKFR